MMARSLPETRHYAKGTAEKKFIVLLIIVTALISSLFIVDLLEDVGEYAQDIDRKEMLSFMPSDHTENIRSSKSISQFLRTTDVDKREDERALSERRSDGEEIPQLETTFNSAEIRGTKAVVLMGIFCRKSSDEEYQKVFRLLFSIHPLVCSLGKYRRDVTGGGSSHCEFVYVFVMGANKAEGAATQVLDDRKRLILETGDDHVVLNIKENMEDGKTQTYFYYASTIMKEENKLNFDYVAKMDTDTLIYLDQYFDFADKYLNPAPYNRNTIAGLFSDKEWWYSVDKAREEKRRQKEYFFNRFYPGGGKFLSLHIYPMGQLYMYSADQIDGIVEISKRAAMGNKVKYKELEGVEDHDIATLAYMASWGRPMNILQISGRNKFWLHDVKINKIKGWKGIWEDEIDRIKTYVRSVTA